MATLVALAEFGDVGMAGVLDIVFCRDAAIYGSNNSLGRFAGVAHLLRSEREAVQAALSDSAADVRAEVVAAIGRFGLQADFLPMVLDAATGSSKKVRGAARQALTGANRKALTALVQDRFATAAVGQRIELVDVAAMCLGDDAATVIAGLRAGETNAKVLAAFDRTAGSTIASPRAEDESPVRRDSAEGYTAVGGDWVAIPPLADLPEPTPLDRDVLAVLDPAVKAYNAKLAAVQKEHASAAKWHWSRQLSPVDKRTIDALKSLAEATHTISSPQTTAGWIRSHLSPHPAIDRFFDDPRVSLNHLVRIALATGNAHFPHLFNEWSGPAGAAIQRRLAQGGDVRTLLGLWTANGGKEFIRDHLTERWHTAIFDIEIPLWPVVAGHFAELDEAVGVVPQTGRCADAHHCGPGIAGAPAQTARTLSQPPDDSGQRQFAPYPRTGTRAVARNAGHCRRDCAATGRWPPGCARTGRRLAGKAWRARSGPRRSAARSRANAAIWHVRR